ncbi:hypothetical protein N480_13730 [Pseudoalteromonas luteoviolacea S2607]|nr:hypothetical protein N480_13730 [Pseudoalteromonas luteoviolacea S2607]
MIAIECQLIVVFIEDLKWLALPTVPPFSIFKQVNRGVLSLQFLSATNR